MDTKLYSIIGVFGSSMYLALGFIAFGAMASSNSGLAYYSLTPTYYEWVETGVALAVGFVLLTVGWLVGTGSPGKATLGGVVGVVSGIGGALNGLALSTLTYNYANQLTSLIPGSAFIVLFFGFPLVMAASVGGLLTRGGPGDS